MKTKVNYIRLIFLLIPLLSCNTKGELKDFDYGHVENNVYRNSFFDMEVALPDDWFIATRAQTERMTETGKNIIAGNDEGLKDIINASEVNTANLLAVFKYEVGSAVAYNPNCMIVAESIKDMPGIKTGGDYLFHTRRFLEQSQMQYRFAEEKFEKETINDREFYVMKLSLDYAGLVIRQTYYATIKNGFAVIAVISYIDDEQQAALKSIINAITFKS